MLEMFKGVANSPETTITNNISNLDTIIYVLDETRVPTELPNLMVLGTGSGAETIKVVSVDGNAITVERGFQGVAKAWNAGTIIARNFTEYDYNALLENIKEKDLEIEALQLEVDEHKADYANHKLDLITDVDGAHGLKVESGIFTPTIAGSITAGEHSYTLQKGFYQKIGKTIIAHCVVLLSAKDASMDGNVEIRGLPFVSNNQPWRINSATLGNISKVTYTGIPSAQIPDNTSKITIFHNSSAANANQLQSSAIVATTRFDITAIYQTA